MDNQSDITKGDNAKSKKGRLSFLYVTLCLVLFYIPTKYYKNIAKGLVCVEVLPPSQPNGVMSSMVSLPNYMFTGQA